MRVLHFHFGKDGGAERFFVHLLNALAEKGVEQTIVIRPGRKWKTEIHGSVEILESHFRTASPDRLLLPLRVKALIKSWKPDSILGWMPKGAKLVPGNVEPLRLARLGDYPTSLRKFRNIDTLVCNTPGIAHHVRSMGWDRGVEVISNFTSLERLAPVDRKLLDTPTDAFVISSMGRFVPRKGFDVLIRSLLDLPDAYLWLIGGGEEEGNLKGLADHLGVADRVRFAGWQKEPRRFVAASDCFAMASSHEPLGNVILEAWAQAIPVVSTKAEGPLWFMRHGENGLMVDIGDHKAFAAEFARIRADSELAGRLVSGGLDTLEQQFSADAVAQTYIDLFVSRSKRAA
ncbi:MAG: glycosyl transferase [Mesorhizobium sp. SCN 65-20]|mgnify:CR=1 FL=1|nr:MAG: glycosyl transferase [Mesorhizobium sp. SCN 65-20]